MNGMDATTLFLENGKYPASACAHSHSLQDFQFKTLGN
jgi:hypothetical protein